MEQRDELVKNLKKASGAYNELYKKLKELTAHEAVLQSQANSDNDQRAALEKVRASVYDIRDAFSASSDEVLEARQALEDFDLAAARAARANELDAKVSALMVDVHAILTRRGE